MPPLLLGALASIFIGISDTFGRASARRASSISHVSTQMFVGTFATLPLLLVVSSSFRSTDVMLGALSGVCVGLGLSIVYKAMADSSSAIAAPIAGVIAAVLPLTWDLGFGGGSISGLTAVGCAIAIAALAIVSYNPVMEQDARRSGITMAVVGGVFFGLSIIFAADTSVQSGVWPATSQRFVAFVMMALIAKRSSVPVFLPANLRGLGIGGGFAGAFGMAALVVGSQQGQLGTVTVVAATYPAVIVVLATLFDDDEIHWWQAIGIAGAIAGTALIALG